MLRRLFASLSLASALALSGPQVAQMAVSYDATPIVQIFASPTQGGGSCGITVAWEHQGQPLVDRWRVDNTMAHSCLALLNTSDGTEIWRATVAASTSTEFVAAQVLSAADAQGFNWRRATKLNDYSFGLSG